MVANSGCAATMWQIMLLTQLISNVWSEGPPPPINVHYDGLVRWSGPLAHSNVSYTVQYLSLDSLQWYNISSCVKSQNTSCDVTATMEDAALGCVRLHVLAHERNFTSEPEEACSQQGNACSPEVQLSSQPGTLTVNLRGDHPLVYNHGSAVEHQVYLAREGEPLKPYSTSPSSLVIKELEQGERYCVKVFFSYYETPLGPPSCVKCLHIPLSNERAKRLEVALGLGVTTSVVLVGLLLVYILLFQKTKIKEWLRPLYQEAECTREILSGQSQVASGPTNEHWDRISLILPLEDQPPAT